MKKVVSILRFIFLVLTFLGAAYVIIQEGNVSAGYAAVPCLLSLACGMLYRNMR